MGGKRTKFFFFFVCLFGCVDRVVESGLVYLRKNKINKLNFLGTYVSDFSDFLFIICIVEYNKLFDSDFFFLFFFFSFFFCCFVIMVSNHATHHLILALASFIKRDPADRERKMSCEYYEVIYSNPVFLISLPTI